MNENIRKWAIGLGIVTGIFSLFVIFGPRSASSSDGPISVVLSAGLVAVCAGFFWYGVLAIFAFIVFPIISSPFRVLGEWRLNAAERRRVRQEANRSWQQQRDYERAAPERARLAADQANAQKRREDARAACELLYHRYAYVLAERFPQGTFEQFMTKYLGDGQAPEHVDQRARQLQDIILQHAHQIEVPETPFTIESLAHWYKTTKRTIEKLAVEDRYKQAQLAHLNARYAELMQEVMEKLQP